MQSLNRKLLDEANKLPEDIDVKTYTSDLPEKVIQFGEGNFLRAFVDWMFHRLNTENLFNGKIVVVQPIENGLADKLNEQDGLYTLIQRGVEKGKATETKEIISSISRGINAYKDWADVLKCAQDPNIEYVVSNTTEAGIAYDPQDSFDAKPPRSFPGKLAVYLFHRYNHFNGEPSKGMVIIPCELIDRNGDNLKEIVLKLAKQWNYPEDCIQWINKSCQFLNTLVDRVVPGYPKDEIQGITEGLGYIDNLLCTSEIYHLWAIEGKKELSERLPFDKIGLNVIWTEDLTLYRTRKVRILNGAHTSSVPGAYLYGIDTVGEMTNHGVLGEFMRELIYKEVIPSLSYNKEMLQEYGESVFERFANPYIKHYLISILLNSVSKYKTRVLPSIIEYLNKFNSLPDKLTFSLAALIFLYKGGRVIDGEMIASRGKGKFTIKDDLQVLEFFEEIWGTFDGNPSSIADISRTILGNEMLWGQDLNKIYGLTDKVSGYLNDLTFMEIEKVYKKIMHK